MRAEKLITLMAAITSFVSPSLADPLSPGQVYCSPGTNGNVLSCPSYSQIVPDAAVAGFSVSGDFTVLAMNNGTLSISYFVYQTFSLAAGTYQLNTTVDDLTTGEGSGATPLISFSDISSLNGTQMTYTDPATPIYLGVRVIGSASGLVIIPSDGLYELDEAFNATYGAAAAHRVFNVLSVSSYLSVPAGPSIPEPGSLTLIGMATGALFFMLRSKTILRTRRPEINRFVTAAALQSPEANPVSSGHREACFHREVQ